MKHREQYFDIIRAVACVLVVLTHCVPPAPAGSSGAVHSFVTFICAPSPELFMALSGALILPVATSAGEFLGRRFLRLIPPFAFWSVAAVAWLFFSGAATGAETITSLVSIPITPVVGVYWYFYVIFGFYLFAPIVSPWLAGASRREVWWFLAVWGLTLVLGSASGVFTTLPVDPTGNYFFILSSFGGFLGYMVMGFVMRRHTGPRTVLKNVVVPVTIVVALMLSGLAGYLTGKVPSALFLDNLSPVRALMVWAMFMAIKGVRLPDGTVSKLVYDISDCSLGIYLVHFFIARGFVWQVIGRAGMMSLHPAIYIAVSLVLSFTLSYGVVRAIKLLPWGKYIVG